MVELTEVRQQRHSWQKEATQQLAAGHTAEARNAGTSRATGHRSGAYGVPLHIEPRYSPTAPVYQPNSVGIVWLHAGQRYL